MRLSVFHSLLLVSISALALAACGGPTSGTGQAKTEAPMPPVTNIDTELAAKTTASTKPLPLDDNDTLTPVMPMAAPAVSATTTQAIGNADPVSASLEARVARLEQSVGTLRSDYDRIMPAFASLNTTNERIQTLLDEMEADGKIPPVVAASRPVPKVAAPKTAMKVEPSEEEQAMMADEPAMTTAPEKVAPAAAATEAPPSSGLASAVTALRIGEHPDKTRLVLDMDAAAKPTFKYDVDHDEKLLLIDLPSSAWEGKTTGRPNSPLVSGWDVQKGASGGSTLAIQLKKDARVLSSEFLKAEGGEGARLVLDIASGG